MSDKVGDGCPPAEPLTSWGREGGAAEEVCSLSPVGMWTAEERLPSPSPVQHLLLSSQVWPASPSSARDNLYHCLSLFLGLQLAEAYAPWLMSLSLLQENHIQTYCSLVQ